MNKEMELIEDDELVAVISAAIAAHNQSIPKIKVIKYVQPVYRIDSAWNFQAKIEAMPNYNFD